MNVLTLDILVVSVGIISVFFTYKVYAKLKGFLLVDVSVNLKGFENHEECYSLQNIINYITENGLSGSLKDKIYSKVNIKNIGYQSVTIESCYIKKIAFLPDQDKFNSYPKYSKKNDLIKNRSKSILRGRTFSELNIVVLEKYKNLESFIDNKEILHNKLNMEPFTVRRMSKYSINISDHFNDILFEFEGNQYSFYFLDIYCLDTLGRKWALCKKANELLGKYSIGIILNESFLYKI